jgi:WD40 repeat protein
MRHFLFILACSFFFSPCLVLSDDNKPASPAEIDRLIKQLGSDEFEQRQAASKALEAIGEPALDALRKTANKSDNAEIRRRAVDVVRAAYAGKELRCFTGHAGAVFSVAFGRDGKRALSGGLDRTLRLWDVQTGKELRRITDLPDVVYSVALSPDGKRALSGGRDKTIRMWEVETGKQLQSLTGHTSLVYSLAFSPDGKQALSGSFDQSVRLWDVETGKELRCFEGHRDFVYSVAFSPDGKAVLSGSEDTTVRLWDVETGKQWRCITGDMEYRRVALSALSLGGSLGYSSVAFSPDGKLALGGRRDGAARLWDVQTGKELRNFPAHSNEVNSVAFSPDGRLVATGGGTGDAQLSGEWKLWDVETGEELHCFRGHTAPVLSVAFSLDGKRVLSGGRDNTVRLWQLSAELASGGGKDK